MSDVDLAGRTALVTGGARRIGRALVLALAGRGARVVVHFRESAAEAAATATAAQRLGAEAVTLGGDLADPAIAAGLIKAAAASFGPPDILINSAALFGSGSALETTVAEWDQYQAINLRAPFLLSQAFARGLPADRPGDIVNLNDYRALRPRDDHFAYTLSKVGLHGLTASLALALAPRVRVNELALGAMLPPPAEGPEYLHTLRDEIPTRRFGDPAEVADALLFVLGNQALTGQTIFLDGGRHLV